MPHRDPGYVHGYHDDEDDRLLAQARSVLPLLHADTRYPDGSTVLEVGCGTGAQTITLARNSPGARFISFDRSEESLARVDSRIRGAGITNVELRREDLWALPFPPASFDHVFVCFVLEHLDRPLDALVLLRKLIKPGGTLTVFEGDHGSTYFHPESALARQAVSWQVEVQRRFGGNACIGRQLYPLLSAAGYREPRVSPRMVYVDASRPQLVHDFTRKTFTGMVEGIRDAAIADGITDAATFDSGIRALLRTAEPDGVFCYTFFKGVALP